MSAVKNAFYFGEYNVIKTDKNDGQATENWIQAVINGNYPLTYLLTVLDLTCIILTTNLTLSLLGLEPISSASTQRAGLLREK